MGRLTLTAHGFCALHVCTRDGARGNRLASCLDEIDSFGSHHQLVECRQRDVEMLSQRHCLVAALVLGESGEGRARLLRRACEVRAADLAMCHSAAESSTSR
eukprot:1162492-Pleurochrysis_carterae.AAC.1